MEDKFIAYGGQAVIEGVMMRGQKACAMAARTQDGDIVVQTEPLSGIYLSRLIKVPFLRGLIVLWDSLGLGMRMLTRSANIQAGEGEKIEGPTLYLTMGFTIFVAVAIFFLAPAGVGWLSERFLHWNAWVSNLLEGVIRLLLLIGYVWIVGFLPDIQRVFAYHGAEHKAVNAYEAGAELKPAVVSTFSRLHTRCGTSFLLSLAVLSLLVFTLLGPLPLEWRLLSRLLMIPVLAGLSYEYFRWVARHVENPLIGVIIKPNLALQSLTTREPDEKMIEVAIAAFQAMRKTEREME